MKLKVFFREGRNEKIAVVLTFLPAERDGRAQSLERGFERIGKELVRKKFVVSTLINQNGCFRFRLFNQLICIIVHPLALV